MCNHVICLICNQKNNNNDNVDNNVNNNNNNNDNNIDEEIKKYEQLNKIFTFGKHKNEKFNIVYMTDKQYFDWINSGKFNNKLNNEYKNYTREFETFIINRPYLML